MFKNSIVLVLLLLTGIASAAPNEGGVSPSGEPARDLRFQLDHRVRSTRSLSGPMRLVPLGEDKVGTDNAEPSGGVKTLPPIMIYAKVKTYEKVVIGRRRMSLSSRGAVSSNPAASDLIYKTVPKVEKKNVDISPLIEKYAQKYDLDPWLIRGVIEVESAFRPSAVSSVGAGGLMQLMPGTASYLGCADRFDPEQNIAAGSRYLRMMLDRFGDEDLMIAAYNAGPGNVERYGGIPPFAETQRYVVKVKGAWKKAKTAHGH